MGLDRESSQESGAAEGTRTPDPIITNDVLYQLSYSGDFLSCLPLLDPVAFVRA